MRLKLAWKNMMHNRVRTLVLLSGMGFSILLLFMQVGFYKASTINSTMIYDMFRFDAVMLAPNYLFISDAGTIPLRRLKIAQADPGVETAAPLFMDQAQMRHPVTGNLNAIMVLGVDVDTAPFKAFANNEKLPLIAMEDSILMDRKAALDYGPLPVGVQTELNGRRVRISGDFSNGAGFISGGSVIMNDATFAKVMGRSIWRPSAALLTFAKGADAHQVMSRLKTRLSGDVQVITRKELNKRERHFFMSINPIGVMFTSGAVIAFMVGAVILYQILSSEVLHHLREYATLKAMGYTDQDLKFVVMAQGLFMTVVGFIPSSGLAFLLYDVLRNTIQVPVRMTPQLLLFIFASSLVMSAISGVLAVRRIETADPAELF